MIGFRQLNGLSGAHRKTVQTYLKLAELGRK
jgi:hypothetical protein